MYLVAIAWMYVVLMIAVAEALSSNGTVVGAVVTLLFYGVLPLAVVMYLMGTPMRRRARQAADAAENSAQAAAQDPSQDGAQITTQPTSSPSIAAPPDGGGHAPGDAVAPERKEV